jgi:hypothetical protein
MADLKLSRINTLITNDLACSGSRYRPANLSCSEMRVALAGGFANPASRSPHAPRSADQIPRHQWRCRNLPRSRSAGFSAEVLPISQLEPASLDKAQLVVFPGGFSYGDYVMSGRISQLITKHKLGDRLKKLWRMVAMCQNPSQPVPALRPGPTRLRPLKSDFLADFCPTSGFTGRARPAATGPVE